MTRRARFGLARLRDPIEEAFGAFGRRVYRHAWLTIALILAAVAGLASQLPRIQVETSTETLLPEDDAVRQSYDLFRERFGQDQAILLAIETEDVFDLGFLGRLRALHEEIEDEVPNLQEVTSLVNARDTRGEIDRLVVGDLLDPFPEDAEAAAVARERALANPLYVDQLISRDGRLTTVVVLPSAWSADGSEEDVLAGFDDEPLEAMESPPAQRLTGEENTAIVRAIEAIVERHRAEDFRIHMAGMPVMTDFFMRAMGVDLARFASLALVTIALALAVLFRRVAAVVLPLLVSVLAMITTVSVMAILGIPMTSVTQIMPSFLLAVGVGGAVHILAVFYQASSAGEGKEEAIVHALRHSGLAVAMTSLTTAGGLVSFVTADVAPIVDLGIVTPIGILAALLFTLVLLPALVAVFPMRDVQPREREAPTRVALAWLGDVAARNPWPMVAAWTALLVVAGFGIGRLWIAHDPMSWFHEENPVRIATMKMNAELGGVMFVDAVVDTGRDNGIRDPEMLGRIERMQALAEATKEGGIVVGKSMSILDVVKETHQALNENRPDFYAIPGDPALLSQELLLFENSGSDDLEELVDSRFSLARYSMKVPFVDALEYEQFIERLEAGFQEILGDSAGVWITGESRVIVRVVDALTSSLVRTYILAFLIISPLMMLLLGSVRIGLISMIPNLTPVVLVLGLMGWLGIPLEMFTMLIGSIALGLAVDDTIHFMHNYRRYYERSGDVRFAVRETLTTTGQALLFTSVVLSSGFFIYTQASLNNLIMFGALTGVTIILAFLADLLFAPAIMSLVSGRTLGAQAREAAAEVAPPAGEVT